MSHTWEQRKASSITLVCAAEGHLVWSMYIIHPCQERVLEPPSFRWAAQDPTTTSLPGLTVWT